MIKKKVFVSYFMALIVVLSISCKKKEDNPDPDQRKTLVFNSLTASDTSIVLGNYTTLTAVADGDELTYIWGSESGFGTVVGSGAVVQWSVCHADRFWVYCDVQDKYGDKLRKTIRISVKP